MRKIDMLKVDGSQVILKTITEMEITTIVKFDNKKETEYVEALEWNCKKLSECMEGHMHRLQLQGFEVVENGYS